MKRKEVLERLCKLQGEVAAHVGYDHAADCFCGQGGFWESPSYRESDYRNDGVALEFIEKAVRDALQHNSQLSEKS